MEQNMDRYVGQMLDNRYEILGIIGSGGMAVVYKALCHRLNRYVAIKILKDEYAQNVDFCEHFQAESQAVAMLSHPNIVGVYDFSKSSDCQYIVMELLEGITLKQYMTKKGALSWKESLHFATQIARALSHAHSKGVIHRDIKPQNIMVVKDGSIKVADFGIAYLQNSAKSNEAETMGSIHYLSPEQARGEQLDARSDIFSLGVVMYEMLTGRLPYEGETIEEVALQHFGAPITMPGDINPDIPLELEQITMKAMASDINARYQSADELLEDLESFRKHQAAGENTDDAQPVIYEAGVHDKGYVRPVSRTGELSKEDYARRKIRARKVSTFSGIALVVIFLMAVLAFLWNYWIKDMFVDADRITIPNFIGENSDEIIDSDVYKDLFNFTIVRAVNPDVPEGTVTDQNPDPGRRIIPTTDGIDIELTVSTGILMTKIPELTNHEYREATIALEQLGFKVEQEIVADENITADYVVRTEPAAGEECPAGSTVKIYISGGPELITVPMPDLIGKRRDDAVQIIISNQLSVGSISEVYSNTFAEGVIVWQSVDAGTDVTRNTTIYLQVSLGPEPVTSTEPSDEPSAPPVTDNPATPPPITDPVTPPAEGGGSET